MSERLTAHFQIHFCVLLWGFTAILGKLISLPAVQLTWWRMLLVTLALALVPSVWRAIAALPARLIGIYSLIGVLVALHWLTFYAAIKYSNASVGATMMALAPVFLSLLEPVIARRAFDQRELYLAIAAVPGMAMVVGTVPASMHTGLVLGAVSALFVALFAALNKRYVLAAPPLAITALEMAAGVVVLSLMAPLLSPSQPFVLPGATDAIWLAILAGACTLLPFTLSLVALKHLSAFATQLAINLEPVYTIVIAMVIFSEHRELSPGFYAGVALLVGAVMIQPMLKPHHTLQSPSQAP